MTTKLVATQYTQLSATIITSVWVETQQVAITVIDSNGGQSGLTMTVDELVEHTRNCMILLSKVRSGWPWRRE